MNRRTMTKQKKKVLSNKLTPQKPMAIQRFITFGPKDLPKMVHEYATRHGIIDPKTPLSAVSIHGIGIIAAVDTFYNKTLSEHYEEINRLQASRKLRTTTPRSTEARQDKPSSGFSETSGT